jgi:hypothetical protein
VPAAIVKRVRRYLACGACLIAFAAPTLAGASTERGSVAGLLDSSSLWGTVDACVTSSTADTVGIRGSMPGTGNPHVRMYMWFRLQYRDSAGVWHYIGATGDSRFTSVGNGSYRSRQAGTDFQLAASTAVGTELRGVIIFDWKIGKRLIHHDELDTTARHVVGAGSSPAGYSAAFCTIS